MGSGGCLFAGGFAAPGGAPITPFATEAAPPSSE
jgi:hypothetical protein